MENQQLTADRLVQDWLDQQFPHDILDVQWHVPAMPYYPESDDYSIVCNGVTVGELRDSTLFLLDPTEDKCIVVTLANPESLLLLSKCVKEHQHSDEWGTTMRNNKTIAIMALNEKSQVVHRSPLGYKLIWK